MKPSNAFSSIKTTNKNEDILLSSETLNKSQIDKILKDLNSELSNRNKNLEITVYGGSCLCIISKFRDVTYDVDLTSNDDRLLKDCIESLGYPKDLVNTEMSVFINLRETLDVYKKFSNLVVHVPTLPYLLALKLKSSRDKDLIDCVNLCKELGLNTIEQIKEIFCRYYSAVQFSSHRIMFVNKVLEKLKQLMV